MGPHPDLFLKWVLEIQFKSSYLCGKRRHLPSLFSLTLLTAKELWAPPAGRLAVLATQTATL